MRSIFNFIVTPKAERYNNKKAIGEKELILNTEISDHRYISRSAIILETPIEVKTDIRKGDEVIVHHNVFRRWYDVRGKEKNSTSFIASNLHDGTADIAIGSSSDNGGGSRDEWYGDVQKPEIR